MGRFSSRDLYLYLFYLFVKPHFRIFNASMTITYVTFLVCTLRMYELPVDWSVGGVLVKHTIGFVSVQINKNIFFLC